jgi:hypothetical protein
MKPSNTTTPLNEANLVAVCGGINPTTTVGMADPTAPKFTAPKCIVTPIKAPIYITLAIGEDGGKLPVFLS